MPEGDTIHRMAAALADAFEGRVPREILTPHPRHRLDDWPGRLAGRELRSVDAHGKHLFLRFEGALTLHSHLRMTGLWSVHREGARWRRSPRRAWLVLRDAGREAVQFDGPVLELMADRRTRTEPRLAGLGPDVVAETFDERLFLRRLRGEDPTRALGDALLDQRTLAGMGNLWKSEVCFAAGLDPWRRLADVQDHEALELVAFARRAMSAAVREGPRARPRAVYRRAGRPCPRCGTPIRQRGQGDDNRVTFWCPGCQS
jgi:endonuclease-8